MDTAFYLNHLSSFRGTLSLQRYLIEYFAQPPSSMRDIGTLMAPLHVSH
jgi:hypothetical protein